MLSFLLERKEAEREPTAEVAEHVGMESRPLGRLMAAEGLQAWLTGTGNNKARRYYLRAEGEDRGDTGERRAGELRPG